MLMSGTGRIARLHYLPGTFRVLSNGDHVICAVTGVQIGVIEASDADRDTFATTFALRYGLTNRLEVEARVWPTHSVFLSAPGAREAVCIGDDGACELRACGFSETGRSFVIATSCDLTVFTRQAAPGTSPDVDVTGK